MPKKSVRSRPKYSLHRGTGQARVRINGKDHYLGEYGSAVSRERYDELMRLWFDNHGDVSLQKFTVDDLAILFMRHAEDYYVKNGKPTSEVDCMRQALRRLVGLFGTVRVSDFRPADMKRIRELMIADGIARTSINRHMGRIKHVFRWGVEEGHVSPTVLAGVTAIAGLRAGRSGAVESEPVRPVSEDAIASIEPYVSRQVWGMIRLQRATGMRPGEVIQMRGSDLDMSGGEWEYRPASHKTEHRGKQRIITIGPIGRGVIREFLKTDLLAYLFSPADARAEFDAKRKDNRKTPMTPSQAARLRAKSPTRTPGDHYTVCSYGQAIRKGCELAFEMPEELRKPQADLSDDALVERRRLATEWRRQHCWHPHQLRHTAATQIRKEFGIDAARTVLGHTCASVTEVYAEMDQDKARAVMAKIG